jgi:hypothetical protein
MRDALTAYGQLFSGRKSSVPSVPPSEARLSVNDSRSQTCEAEASRDAAGEVIRLAGIVWRTNKLERDKWTSLYPFGAPKDVNKVKNVPKPWDDEVKQYMTCTGCKGVFRFVASGLSDYDNRIVSIDGKPYCLDCRNKMTKKG